MRVTVVARTASPRTPNRSWRKQARWHALPAGSSQAPLTAALGLIAAGPLDVSIARTPDEPPGDDRSGLGRRPVRFARLERFTPMNRSWTIFRLHASAAIAAGRFSSSRRRSNRSRYPRATPVDLLPSRGRVMYVWLPLRTREVELGILGVIHSQTPLVQPKGLRAV